MTTRSLEGKHAVVTGAAAGIGRATAKELARHGARVSIVDFDANGLAATTDILRALGVDPVVLAVDCTSAAAVEQAFARLGEIDILANVIGSSARERSTDFAISTQAVWRFVHATTLESAMLCTRQVVAGMCARKSGKIVNISSDAALRPQKQMAEYAAAKAGVIGFTRALAQELGEFGINVNAIAPGLIATRAVEQIPESMLEGAKAQIPLNRLGQPEEIAFAIRFLVSNEADYITGQTLAINGGRSFL